MFPTYKTEASHFGALHFVEDTCVTAHDVLMGRGASADRFEGNVRFRALVRQHKDAYIGADHHVGKAAVAQQVVDAVHARKGRFLRRIESSIGAGCASCSNHISNVRWEIIENAVAVEKVKQALRDTQQAESRGHRKPTASRSTSAGSAEDPPIASDDATNAARSRQGNVAHLTAGGVEPEYQIVNHGGPNPPESHEVWACAEGLASFVRSIPPASSTPSDPANAVARAPPAHAVLAARAAAPSTMSQHVQGYLERTVGLQIQDQHPAPSWGPHATPFPTNALSEAVRNEVAFSWREIPGAYLDFLPLVREGVILPFATEDLQILTLTLAWAEASRDMVCLGLIRRVFNTIIKLPPQQLQLTRIDTESLIHAMQTM